MRSAAAERQLFGTGANGEKTGRTYHERLVPGPIRGRAGQGDKVISNQVNLVCKGILHEPSDAVSTGEAFYGLAYTDGCEDRGAEWHAYRCQAHKRRHRRRPS